MLLSVLRVAVEPSSACCCCCSCSSCCSDCCCWSACGSCCCGVAVISKSGYREGVKSSISNTSFWNVALHVSALHGPWGKVSTASCSQHSWHTLACKQMLQGQKHRCNTAFAHMATVWCCRRRCWWCCCSGMPQCLQQGATSCLLCKPASLYGHHRWQTRYELDEAQHTYVVMWLVSLVSRLAHTFTWTVVACEPPGQMQPHTGNNMCVVHNWRRAVLVKPHHNQRWKFL